MCVCAYRSAEDRADGFIHLCTPQQTNAVVKRFYANQTVAVLTLKTDLSSALLHAHIFWEQSYPHLYNMNLTLGDIKAVVEYP
jgi:uncharacterized protein (DUF952 family)